MGLKYESLILLEQIMTIDKKCIGRRITKLTPRLMSVVDKKINVSLGVKKANKAKKEVKHEICTFD